MALSSQAVEPMGLALIGYAILDGTNPSSVLPALLAAEEAPGQM